MDGKVVGKIAASASAYAAATGRDECDDFDVEEVQGLRTNPSQPPQEKVRCTACFRMFVTVVSVAQLVLLGAILQTVTAHPPAANSTTADPLAAYPPTTHPPTTDPPTAQPSTAHSPTAHPPTSFLKLPPGTTSLRINIGPNHSPMVSCDDGGSTVCLLFELQHDVAESLRASLSGAKNTLVFNVGVSNFVGLQAYRIMGGSHTGSTSLSEPSFKSSWNEGDQGGDVAPVMTLGNVLDSLDPELHIEELAVDMQGHDFMGVASAGDRIRRIKRITAEAYNGFSTYSGVSNDLDRDWHPYMKQVGFHLTSSSAGHSEIGPSEGLGAAEFNVQWENDDPAVLR